jgi:hypothetical protein
MMRLGIRTVSGKIGGNGVDFSFDTLKPSFNATESRVHTVDFFGKHLVTFDDNIQLMLKILRQHADMMFKVIRRYTDMMLEHSLDLFEIISIHKISPR